MSSFWRHTAELATSLACATSLRLTVGANRCDGNHGGPRCADHECWNDSLSLYVGWAVLADNGNIRIWHRDKSAALASQERFGGELVMLTSIAPAEPAPAPEGFLLMPEHLTSDNGAKYALSGEFSVSIDVRCPDCDGENEDCGLCHGDGTLKENVEIDWTTVKAIYAKAVELLGVRP